MLSQAQQVGSVPSQDGSNSFDQKAGKDHSQADLVLYQDKNVETNAYSMRSEPLQPQKRARKEDGLARRELRIKAQQD